MLFGLMPFMLMSIGSVFGCSGVALGMSPCSSAMRLSRSDSALRALMGGCSVRSVSVGWLM